LKTGGNITSDTNEKESCNHLIHYKLLSQNSQMDQYPLANFIRLFSENDIGYLELNKIFSNEFL
jgi:hypothetical protein